MKFDVGGPHERFPVKLNFGAYQFIVSVLNTQKLQWAERVARPENE
jgi:hypothetical protein